MATQVRGIGGEYRLRLEGLEESVGSGWRGLEESVGSVLGGIGGEYRPRLEGLEESVGSGWRGSERVSALHVGSLYGVRYFAFSTFGDMFACYGQN